LSQIGEHRSLRRDFDVARGVAVDAAEHAGRDGRVLAQQLSQLDRAVEVGSVERSRDIDRQPLIGRAELPDGVEVLQREAQSNH
jgi:hypothetical protein